MEKTFTKSEDGKLVETYTEEKVTVVEHSLDELIAIRESIDVSEAESLAMYQAEKDKFDILISEAKKQGIKTQEELSEVIQ